MRVTGAEQAHGLVNELSKVRTAIATRTKYIWWRIFLSVVDYPLLSKDLKLINQFNFGSFAQKVSIKRKKLCPDIN